ncbi:hypothetical protein [Verminephrobacter aporrectodeae]|uniref:hypothetical protein n=1 Tax=Verminephrobacter aporrectodeae TaxID=1110389 RepID=UPI002242CB04|nr:hypothetical protein [Verminephrobacter aporrectodeae]
MRAGEHALSLEIFKGWPAIVLRQGDLALSLVPAVGGRLMGIRAGVHELCFIHPGLQGKTFSGDERQWRDLCGDWAFPLWGGGKTWVAPESAWPRGSPHRDLDSLAWKLTASWCHASAMGLSLESPICSDSGLQIIRRLDWPVGAREWSIAHTLRNAGTRTVRCGVWDVLMLRRPAIVRIPLPPTPSGSAPGVTSLPGKASVASLMEEGIIDGTACSAHVHCHVAKEFKCGFQSERGEIEVEFTEWNVRYARRSEVDATRVHAHAHPLEVFNAAQLPYFEVETHSPLQTLAPGDFIHYAIHERVEFTQLLGPSARP